MAETDWLGMLGGLAGQVGGAYLGAYAGNPQWGAQVGGALGSSLGSATSQETGLTEGAGYDPNAMYGSFSQGMAGGGGGMGGMGGGGGMDLSGLMGMFGGGGGGGGGVGGSPMYRAPMMSTQNLFGMAGSMGPMLAESGNAFNFARQPGYTQSQLNAEQQITPGTFGLRRDALAARQRDLDLGYQLPPELQDLVITNALQGMGTSGVGGTNLGRLFGARSLAGAGLDRGEARIAAAERAAQFQPGNYTPLDPWGQTPLLTAAMDVRGVEAMQNNVANLNMATQAAAQQKQSADQANAFSSILGQAGQYMKGSGAKNVPLSKDYTGTLGSGQRSASQKLDDMTMGGITGRGSDGNWQYNPNLTWNERSGGSNLGGDTWTGSFAM